MENSQYINNVKAAFDSSFPEGWLEKYDWWLTKSSTNSFIEGNKVIESFRVECFVNFAKLILSGDFFINETDELLKSLDTNTLYEANNSNNKIKNALIESYQDMLADLHDSIQLVSYYINCTKRRFEQKHLDDLFTAIEYPKQRYKRHDFVKMLDYILQTCQFEFEFRYNVDLINQMLLLRETLKQFKFSDEINNIRDAAVIKLELLLYKISYFSKNKIIQYNFNLQHINLQPLNDETSEVIKYKDLFCKYLDVEIWSQDQTNDYIVNPDAEAIDLWKAVMLMRYYTKKTKNIMQIDNLLALTDKHYFESIKADSSNLVNLYADKSSRNYFYNSRFSFLCQYSKDYNYEEMKRDLTKIDQIQNDTFVFNYHPYQKAFSYLTNLVNRELNENKSADEIKPHLEYLEYCYNRFKETIEWCKANQPYILQLRFDFSTVDDKKRNLKIFYPSSFLRPLRFDHLDAKVIDFQNQLSLIRYSVESQPQRNELVTAEHKIENMEKDSYKVMGFFSAIIIFLVGTISIFTGNDSNISVFTKMEYVTVLGSILLLFVCFGYIATCHFSRTIKHWIFGIATGVLITLLVSYFLNRHELEDDHYSQKIELTITPKKTPIIRPVK